MSALDLSCATWRKSTRSANSANCVEVAFDGAAVGVRDSKAPGGGVLVFSPRRWADFLGSLSQSGR